MRDITAGVKAVLKTAATLDKHGFYAYADVLHSVLKRMANDEEFFAGDFDEGWRPPDDNAEEPSMEELERAGMESELFDLIMKREYSPEGLTMEDAERIRELMHYLKGGTWNSFKQENYGRTPEDERFKNLISNPMADEINDMAYSGHPDFVDYDN